MSGFPRPPSPGKARPPKWMAPKKIFYSALVGEFLRIARATLRLSDLIPKGIDLVNRMVNQGGDRKSVEHFLLKIIRQHPDSFSPFRLRPEDLIQKCFPN